MKHSIETIKQKIRDCDEGRCKLVDVLVEVNETEKELREMDLEQWAKEHAFKFYGHSAILKIFLEKEILGKP